MKLFLEEVTDLELAKVVVRPVSREEKDDWKELISRYHYLGYNGAVGEQVFYVATVNDVWVALIGWCAASWKNGHRDQWIGWNSIIREKRLHLIANNFRFCVLPNVSVYNLASRVLSLNLKRLSSDWEQFYKHPILLAETFVDHRFQGTCYKASGWSYLGETSGYSRKGTGYIFNGEPKRVYIKPLCRKVAAMLSDPRFEIKGKEVVIMNWRKLPVEGKKGLIDVLREIYDYRCKRGRRYPIAGILAIAVCAMLSGCTSIIGISRWAKKLNKRDIQKFRIRRDTIPSMVTIYRVLTRINAQEFDEKIYSWLTSIEESKSKVIAVDGKTLRGSCDGDKKARHLLSALLHDEMVTVSQVEVGEKTNEIPMLKELLDPLDIKGGIVTADAMHTQDESARYVVMEKKSRLRSHGERESAQTSDFAQRPEI